MGLTVGWHRGGKVTAGRWLRPMGAREETETTLTRHVQVIGR